MKKIKNLKIIKLIICIWKFFLIKKHKIYNKLKYPIKKLLQSERRNRDYQKIKNNYHLEFLKHK